LVVGPPKPVAFQGLGLVAAGGGVVVLLGFHCVAELGFQEEEEEEEETRGERRRIGEGICNYVDYQIDVFFCEFCQVETQCASGADDGGCEAASRVRRVWGLR
jgi:hypothetical protein